MKYFSPCDNSWGRGLLVLALWAAPLVFSTRTVEAFELPKLFALLSLCIFLGAVALARGGWSLLALWRPLPLAVAGFLLSATLSTVFSMQPLTSFFGAPESMAGLVTLGS